MLIALLNQDPCAEVAFCQRCIRKFNHVSSKIIKSNLYWHQHWASSLISLCHQLISAVHCALAFNCSKCPCHYPPRVASFQTVRDLPLRSGIFKKSVCIWLMQPYLVQLCFHNVALGYRAIRARQLFLPFLIQASCTELQRSRQEPRGKIW